MRSLPLRTAALVLRQLTPADTQDMMRLNGEPTTSVWLPSHVYRTPEDAAEAVACLVARYSAPGNPRLGPYVLGVEHAAAARLLGHVGFSALGGEVEISYAIAEDSRGHGYATEAIGAACQWAASAFGLDKIVALTSTANVASRRTLARAGFCQTGERTMSFQGRREAVSLYAWFPPAQASG